MTLDSDGKITEYRKSTSDVDDIGNIVNEYQGINWYNSCFNNKKIEASGFYESDQYASITIKKIAGCSVTSFTYKENINLLENAVAHYVSVWGSAESSVESSNLHPLHGDFSLSNIVVEKSNDIVIIDWEHFHKEGAPIGFDAVYLLIESICFEFLEYNKISKETKAHSRKMIEVINSEKLLDIKFKEQGVYNYLKAFVLENTVLWGAQFRKIPFLDCPRFDAAIEDCNFTL